MTEQDAEKLSITLLKIVALLDQTAAFVRDKDNKQNWDIYCRAVGRAMGEVCLELEEPLWARFPNLKPEFLGGPYKINPAIYEPRFYESEE